MIGRVAAGLVLLFLLAGAGGMAYGQASDSTRTPSSAKKASRALSKHSKASSRRRARPRHRRRRASQASRRRETARIRRAFVASSELRPMAQQLATLRTPAAYAGVTAYANRHSGDAAAAAHLALGHAYL
ncbi:MAG: hypothetical protein ACLGSH_06480, partial [Acidobacteriota bacterium]